MYDNERTHNALGIANWFIEVGNFHTPMQIIKLVYLSHGWMLGLHNRSLIQQRVEAWKYGPVIPDVYHSIKKYGLMPVEESIPNAPIPDLDSIELDLIDQVNEKYGRYSGFFLSRLTHAKGSPWDQVWNSRQRNTEIPNDMIQKYFENLAKTAKRNDRR